MSLIDEDDVFGDMISDYDDENAGNEENTGTGRRKESSASDPNVDRVGDCDLTDEKPSKRCRSKSDTTGKRAGGGNGGGGGGKRNERERKRVDKLNQGFDCLRQCFPDGRKNKRLSKVGTLKGAYQHIQTLLQILAEPIDSKAPAFHQQDMGMILSGYHMVNGVTGYSIGYDVTNPALINDVTGFYGTVNNASGLRDAGQFSANCDIKRIHSSSGNVIAPTDGVYAQAAQIRDVIGMENPKNSQHVITETDDVYNACAALSMGVTGLGNQLFPVNGMSQIDDVYARPVTHTSDAAGMGIPMYEIDVISPAADDVYAPPDVNGMGNPIYANSLTDYLNHNAPLDDVFNSMAGGDPNCSSQESIFKSLAQKVNIENYHILEKAFSRNCTVVTKNDLNVPDSNPDTSGQDSNQTAFVPDSARNPSRAGSNPTSFRLDSIPIWFDLGSNPSYFRPGSNSSHFEPGSKPSSVGPSSNPSSVGSGSTSSSFEPGSNPRSFGPSSNSSCFGPGSNPSCFGPASFVPGSNPSQFEPGSNPSSVGPSSSPSSLGSGSTSSSFEPGSNPRSFGPSSNSSSFGPGSNPSCFGPASFVPGSNPSQFEPGLNPSSVEPSSNLSSFGSGSNPSSVGPGSIPSSFEPGSNSSLFGPDSISTTFDLEEFQIMANECDDLTQMILGSQMYPEFPVQTSHDITTEEMLSGLD